MTSSKYTYEHGTIYGPNTVISIAGLTAFQSIQLVTHLNYALQVGKESMRPLVSPPSMPNASRAPETKARRAVLDKQHAEKLAFVTCKVLYDLNQKVTGDRLRRYVANGSAKVIEALHWLEKQGVIERTYYKKRATGWVITTEGRVYYENWRKVKPELAAEVDLANA